MLDQAMLTNTIHTVFGWPLHVPPNANDRSLRNFPMQANGAEMLRLACCLGTERGIELCAPVHDAVLITAPLDRIEADITAMQQVMAEASRVVLDGLELRSDVAVTRYPDRYMDERGQVMWDRVMALVAASEAQEHHQVLPGTEHPCCPLSNTPSFAPKPAESLEF
jgi:hypothetical protein